VDAYSDLFKSRRLEKVYLAVVHGVPAKSHWICREKLASDPKSIGRVAADERKGKPAETDFRVLQTAGSHTVLEARPYTGRTHQIRVHLLVSGLPVVGDGLYAPEASRKPPARFHRDSAFPLGLRAIGLSYTNPFTRERADITAPTERFLNAFKFSDRAP
jgi:23S rRNA-/tRNA-specific pseudouridylate synthase